MVIVKTEGCTANDIRFDGKSWIDFTESEKRNILAHLFSILEGQIIHSGEASIQDLMGVVQPDSEENDGVVCDQCGDTVTTTVWKV